VCVCVCVCVCVVKSQGRVRSSEHCSLIVGLSLGNNESDFDECNFSSQISNSSELKKDERGLRMCVFEKEREEIELTREAVRAYEREYV